MSKGRLAVPWFFEVVLAPPIKRPLAPLGDIVTLNGETLYVMPEIGHRHSPAPAIGSPSGKDPSPNLSKHSEGPVWKGQCHRPSARHN